MVAEFIFSDMTQTKMTCINSGCCFVLRIIFFIRLRLLTRNHRFRIPLGKSEILGESLSRDSFIRPNLMMTVSEGLIDRKIGSLPEVKMKIVRETVKNIVDGNI